MSKKDGETDWEALLKKEGMPSNLKKENLGKRIRLGLGVKSRKEEELEDDGGHAFTCPIVMGRSLDGQLDQPNDRPVERD
jgi:hypothetical protein